MYNNYYWYNYCVVAELGDGIDHDLAVEIPLVETVIVVVAHLQWGEKSLRCMIVSWWYFVPLHSPHRARGKKENTSRRKDSPVVEKIEKKQPEPIPPQPQQQQQQVSSQSREKQPQSVKKKVKTATTTTATFSNEKKQQKPSAEETTKTKEITVEEVEAVQRKIEEEMIKRRERMATWRAARQKEDEEAKPKAGDGIENGGGEEDEEGYKAGLWRMMMTDQTW